MTVFFHPKYLEHRQAGAHPECPERLSSIMAKLEEHDLLDDLQHPKEPLDVPTVERIHENSYIGMIESFGEGYLDPDTYHREETYEIAMLAARGGVMAAEYSFESKRPSIALVRPPGHHAGADYSGGFCYFNNIAIAAQYLIDKKNIKRVAIVDYDVHHGNGTEDIFFKRSDVLYISTHQWGIYPGTGHFNHVGEDKGEGFTLNIPFLHGTGDSTYELAYEKVIKPALTQYKPDMILISIGGDAHYLDPIATLSLSSTGYHFLASETIKLTGDICSGRIAFFLEGGYDLDALAEIVASLVAEFQGKTIPLQYKVVSDKNRLGFDIVDDVKKVQGEFWNLD